MEGKGENGRGVGEPGTWHDLLLGKSGEPGDGCISVRPQRVRPLCFLAGHRARQDSSAGTRGRSRMEVPAKRFSDSQGW